jgi:PIN domain nuclease of toxin-antitoxin system
MKILLDTHAFLWLITDNKKLSHKAREEFLNEENLIFFSAASLWEMAIKTSLGKLELMPDWPEAIREELAVNSIKWLPIEMEHCFRIRSLTFHHRDPFDRLLIAQALCENMALMSCNSCFSNYRVDLVW